jgi:protein CpxP
MGKEGINRHLESDMKNAIKGLVLAMLFMAGALPAEGGMDGEKGKHWGKGGAEGIMKKLDLSEAQKEKIKAMREGKREKNEATKKAMQAARKELRELLSKADRSEPHLNALRAKHAEIAKLEAEQSDERFESMLAIRGVLDDAQLKKFIELKGKGGPGGKEGRGKKGGKKP